MSGSRTSNWRANAAQSRRVAALTSGCSFSEVVSASVMFRMTTMIVTVVATVVMMVVDAVGYGVGSPRP